MPQPRIRIFWDLVSCPPSTDYVSPAEILKDVRQFTSNFGVVNSIKAYWDSSKISRLDGSLCAAMPSIGVNLSDCSSMQGHSDDALIKTLIVDTLISAMDDDSNSDEKDILMIISGDASVLYPISLLMFRNYTVFLVVPDEDDAKPFQATRIFRWYQDVLGSRPNPDPEQSTATLGLMSPPQRSVTSGQYLPPSRPPVSFAVSAMTPKSKDGISLPSPHYSTPSALSPSVLAVRNLENNRAEEVSASLKPSAPSRHDKIQPSQVPEPVPKKESIQQNEVDDWGTNGGWSTSGGWSMTGGNWDSDLVVPAPKPEVKSKQLERESRLAHEQKSKAVQPPPKKPRSGPSPASAQASNPGKKEKPPAPAFHPAFDPLLQILREAENQSMKRSQLGEHLAKRKGLYNLAGASGFSEYIQLAVKDNLITLRGVDKFQTIDLKKKA